jgi:hypothetical protein
VTETLVVIVPFTGRFEFACSDLISDEIASFLLPLLAII